ncbi:MAG: cysteine desulfurase [Treponema sp.]|nr:cysteine desulfurase [Treponema sp.]
MSGENNKKRIYFDWAASAPTSAPASAPAGTDSAQNNSCVFFGNPSSQHYEGKAAKDALENARERCASVLNVPVRTLFFTSGGTESNSTSLFSNLTRAGHGRILSSAAEHASIREAMETLRKMGKPTGQIAVDSAGRVTIETLRKALEKYPDTRFVSIMAVNNETGTVANIAEISSYLQNKTKNSAPIHFHCDLVQAIGKIPIDIHNWQIDSAAISAHKIGGPRGIGLLYLRKPIENFYSGGGQEKGVRGGTENVEGAVGLADCLERLNNFNSMLNSSCLAAEKRMNKLITALGKMNRCCLIPSARITETSASAFSPYILQAAFKDIPGEVMARALDDLGFAVSTGSACSSTSPERPVLEAMGIEEKLRIESIRISQGYTTTDEDINSLIAAIEEVLNFL